MVKEKLIIDGTTIPIDKGISTVLTYSIKDIQQPDKIKSNYSKTIKLPGSKAIADKLNYVFDVNIDGTFNPNLKLDASYYQDDVVVFSGFIQLKDIIKKDFDEVDYQVVLFGEVANIFRELGNKFLNDSGMNWSELDHDYTQPIQDNSWNTSYILNGAPTGFSYGSGFVYPMINYGNDTDISVYNVNEMFPAAYAKEYIDRMFADAGFTYTSTFFDSPYFKRLIIPYAGQSFKPTQSALSPRRVAADTPLFLSSGIDNVTIDTSTLPSVLSNNTSFVADTIRHTVESIDANAQHDTTNGKITIGATGSYRVTFNALLQTDITPKAGSAAVGSLLVNGDAMFITDLSIRVNGSAVNAVSSFVQATALTPAVTYSTTYPTTYPDSNFKDIYIDDRNYNPPNQYVVNIDIDLVAGDEVTAVVSNAWTFFNSPQILTDHPFYDSATYDGYHADVKTTLKVSNFSLNIVDSPYAEGDTIDFNSAIPEKIKQRDFLTSIIKMHNLYMFPDADNPKNLIIETREDFYNTDVVDWSSKLDYSKPMNLTPTSATNKQKYLYTYKMDKDYYNEKYDDSWAKTYGNREVYIDNDFNKTEHKTELIFSPTPLVGQLTNDRVISTIIDVDKNLQQKTIKSNIRILYYGGMKTSTLNWLHEANAGDIWQSSYPFAAHFNDAYSPTIDINFGLPEEIYYDNTYGTITMSDNNLYNVYHKKELEQLTDKDSKIFKGYFLLDPVDIMNLSFRASYWFDNSYWNLHKVEYTSSSYQPSRCEFLKLKTIPIFTYNTEYLYGGTETIGDESAPAMYKSKLSDGNTAELRSVEIKGQDNFVDNTARDIEIVGDNNKVFAESTNISISGDNNVIESNLNNITLINTSDITVTESNVTYVNGQKIGGDAIKLLTVADTYSQDLTLRGYEIDTTNGYIEIELTDGLHEGYEQTFKKVGGNNEFRLAGDRFFNGTIENESYISIHTINDSITLYYNGTDWKIK